MFVGMPEQLAGRLSIASFNTRGVPVLGSRAAFFGTAGGHELPPAGMLPRLRPYSES